MKEITSLQIVSSSTKKYILKCITSKNVTYLFNKFIGIGICEYKNSLEVVIYDLVNRKYIPFSNRLLYSILSNDVWQKLMEEAKNTIESEALVSRKAQIDLLVHIYTFDRYASDLMSGNFQKYDRLFEEMSEFQRSEINKVMSG
jgi:hypothetical protein